MTTLEKVTTQVKTASAHEAKASVIAVITLAFAADPVVRWMYPEPHQYTAYWPEFVAAFGGKAFEHGTADYVDDFAGAALWLPPGVQPDEEPLVSLLQRSVAEPELGDVFAVLEQMGSYHPTGPHWYLPLIGVDPSQQGKGYGSALLSEALNRCDREGLVAYLESSNPRNVPLYERHGFEVRGTIQAGSSPPLWPMTRMPR